MINYQNKFFGYQNKKKINIWFEVQLKVLWILDQENSMLGLVIEEY